MSFPDQPQTLLQPRGYYTRALPFSVLRKCPILSCTFFFATCSPVPVLDDHLTALGPPSSDVVGPRKLVDLLLQVHRLHTTRKTLLTSLKL